MGEAFVDDTALLLLWILCMGLIFMMLTTLLMQQSAQRWARLVVHTTGGALNLLKFFWYGIHCWYYTDTGIPRMHKIQADDPNIDISPGDGDHPSLTQSLK
jgi:hypothetical protein